MNQDNPGRIEFILVSPQHNYKGRHGKPAGQHPALRRESVRLLAGRGIEGDRYASREEGHPRQITFFDMAVLEEMQRAFDREVLPEAVRRNVFTRHLDLNALVGRRFRMQGILFEGVEPCDPCYWMDQAVAPGAETFLEDRGGLRACILENGNLTIGDAAFALEDAE